MNTSFQTRAHVAAAMDVSSGLYVGAVIVARDG